MGRRWILAIIISILVSLLISSCGSTQTQEDNNNASLELGKIQQELQSVKETLSSAQTRVSELTSKLEEVKKEKEAIQAKYDELSSKYEAAKNELDTIQSKYEELNAKYNAMIKEPPVITEQKIEQAIFELINQERQNNGLNKLEWHKGLYWGAQNHSQHMATKGRLEYADNSHLQDVFRATGYSTVDDIARAALVIWKENIEYKKNFLYPSVINGAVSVYKSEEIFYITYFADIY